MKKACGIQLALYLAIATAIGMLVYRRYPVTSHATMAAVFGGFFLYLGLAYVGGVRGKLREAALIRRANSGVPPRDGQIAAVIGRMSPVREALVSPFTRTPAVAYKYEVDVPGKERSATIYSGFALTPSLIRTPHGSIRLFAYPDLRVVPERTSSADARRNGMAYIEATTFRDPTAGKLRESFAELMALHKDDDGQIRFDQKFAGASTEQLEAATFTEWIVRPGDQVCVVGRYSAQRGAIVFDPENPLEQARIETGDAAEFAGRTVRSAVRYFVAGVVMVAMAVTAIGAFLAMVPIEQGEEMNPEMSVTWPEARFERLIERKLRAPLREAGMLAAPDRDHYLPYGEARGRVNDVRLSTAEAVRENGQTTVHLDGAVVLVLDEQGTPRRLQVLGAEVPPEVWHDHLDVSIVALNADAVRGRISFLSPDRSQPSVRAAFAARVQ